MKSSHDFRGSPMIQCSNGPEKDPRSFYCTTYSTTHKSWQKNVPVKSNSSKENAHFKMPPLFCKRKTGFSSNILSHVEYDQNVDERDFKIGKEAFISSNYVSYKHPPRPIDVIATRSNEVNSMWDSGFTHLPMNEIQSPIDKSPRELKSIMNSSFQSNEFNFKSTKNDKSRIIKSESAFTNDIPHIKALGVDYESPFASRKRIRFPTTTHSFNTNPIKEDGYTRSAPHDVLSAEFYKNLHPQEKYFTQSPNLNVSFSKSQEKASDLKDPKIVIGTKELSGSVRDYPTKLPIVETAPNGRFQSETFRRFIKPSYNWDNKAASKVEFMKPTGFTRGNRHEVTQEAKSDEGLFSALPNSVAKLKWTKEKSIHTARPTGVPYYLNVGE